jgi:cytochrome c biogenesis protein CcmG, thiol:disulfide interchange protein DsbE
LPSTPSSAPPERPARRRSWLVILVGIVVVAGVTGVVATLTASDDDEPGTTSSAQISVGGRAEVGDQAPDFELPALDGNGTVRLSDFRGRPVVLNFWASYCNPCRDEFPLFKQALREHAADDLAVVGVAFQDVPSDSRAFVRATGARWPNGIDERGTVGKQDYGVLALPQTFFIDRDGKIVDRYFAGLTTRAALDQPLEKLLDS